MKLIAADLLEEIHAKVRARNATQRAHQRAELALEDAVDQALASVGARPGWTINLETGETVPPAVKP